MEILFFIQLFGVIAALGWAVFFAFSYVQSPEPLFVVGFSVMVIATIICFFKPETAFFLCCFTLFIFFCLLVYFLCKQILDSLRKLFQK